MNRTVGIVLMLIGIFTLGYSVYADRTTQKANTIVNSKQQPYRGQSRTSTKSYLKEGKWDLTSPSRRLSSI